MEKVFVYGTLKRGECRGLSALPGIKAKFLSDAYISVGELRDLGAFPGLFPHATGVITYGEVWEVDDLKVLDHIEGQRNGFYSRGRVRTRKEDGEWFFEAWTYFCIGVPGDEYPVVEGGNWTGRKYSNEDYQDE
jgi:gamma-glutamylcyclotransferase (GGCT)/AIG2-like uncharacterized protein YtfP